MGEHNLSKKHALETGVIPPPVAAFAAARAPKASKSRKLKIALSAVVFSLVLAAVHRWVFVIRPEVNREAEEWMNNPYEKLAMLEHWHGGKHGHGHGRGNGHSEGHPCHPHHPRPHHPVLNGEIAESYFS